MTYITIPCARSRERELESKMEQERAQAEARFDDMQGFMKGLLDNLKTANMELNAQVAELLRSAEGPPQTNQLMMKSMMRSMEDTIASLRAENHNLRLKVVPPRRGCLKGTKETEGEEPREGPNAVEAEANDEDRSSMAGAPLDAANVQRPAAFAADDEPTVTFTCDGAESEVEHTAASLTSMRPPASPSMQSPSMQEFAEAEALAEAEAQAEGRATDEAAEVEAQAEVKTPEVQADRETEEVEAEDREAEDREAEDRETEEAAHSVGLADTSLLADGVAEDDSSSVGSVGSPTNKAGPPLIPKLAVGKLMIGATVGVRDMPSLPTIGGLGANGMPGLDLSRLPTVDVEGDHPDEDGRRPPTPPALIVERLALAKKLAEEEAAAAAEEMNEASTDDVSLEGKLSVSEPAEEVDEEEAESQWLSERKARITRDAEVAGETKEAGADAVEEAKEEKDEDGVVEDEGDEREGEERRSSFVAVVFDWLKGTSAPNTPNPNSTHMEDNRLED